MVNKRSKVVEISPDLWETKKKSKRSKKLTKEEKEEDEEEEGSPLVGIFCLKKRQDMKIIEENEDCFILDFDPYDSSDPRKHTVPVDDNEVTIIKEKGQVACRDFPHPRHLCLKYPFASTHHATHCNLCYCYVCDVAAPCKHWMPSSKSHCNALENEGWTRLRELHRSKRQ